MYINPMPKPLRRSSPPARSSKRIARRVRPRPMAKGRTASMERECRRLASRITLARCGHRCQCDRQPCRWRATDAAHGLSKGAHPSVEFDLDNLIGLSRRCHERLRSARVDGRGDMSALMLLRQGAVRWLGVLSRSLCPRPSMPEKVSELREICRREGIAA